MTDSDFLEDVGEGAFHSDEENRRIEDETPEDLWDKEFQTLDGELSESDFVVDPELL